VRPFRIAQGCALSFPEDLQPLTRRARQELTDDDRRLRRALIAFFARRVATPAEAEDLSQEVFIRIARAPRGVAPMPDAYIFRIAANLLRDKGRRDKVRTAYREARALDDFLGIDPLDPHRVAEGREDLARVAHAIAELPDKTRRIFTLYRIESIDKHSIAESFGLSVRMVEIHVQRALLALSASIEERR
jgi:RNA polymerase sigma factor (sigma-70 family)